MPSSPIHRALISIFDKTDIVPFATQLHTFGVEILSTGKTASLLRQHHIPVIDVAEYTQFPEMMDGRVKTLHPKIHGGILARRGNDDAILAENHIQPIDLVVVNLYPFEETISKPHCDLADAIENIDIGGPTLLRAAAKNYAYVTAITDPRDYELVLKEMQAHQGKTTDKTRFYLAKKVFAKIAYYDAVISNYLNSLEEKNKSTLFPKNYTVQYTKKQDLRYGENPHQSAAFYIENNPLSGTISYSSQIQGKELSFNNIADTNAALECVKSFSEDFACVIVKHANPCGVGFAKTQIAAYEKAFATDRVSAFGGIIAFNRPLQEAAVKIILEQFVEVIVAPDIEENALKLLEQKPGIRVLRCGIMNNIPLKELTFQCVEGGLLVQDRDSIDLDASQLNMVTTRKPSSEQLQELIFAWRVAKYVKSNAIVFARDYATIGIGAGQMSRVDSVALAMMKAKQAGLKTRGAVMASDAFFPFRDAIDQAAKAGISAIIQPGGSIRDQEIIQAANEANIAMVLTGIRHFRH